MGVAKLLQLLHPAISKLPHRRGRHFFAGLVCEKENKKNKKKKKKSKSQKKTPAY